MKIMTICGSMKYYQEMIEVAEKLELEGNCVLVPIYNPTRKNKDDFTSDEFEMLAKMHKEKIRLADAIFVVNKADYVGSSTKQEIEFAERLGKEIIYYSDVVEKSEIDR